MNHHPQHKIFGVEDADAADDDDDNASLLALQATTLNIL